VAHPSPGVAALPQGLPSVLGRVVVDAAGEKARLALSPVAVSSRPGQDKTCPSMSPPG
jgi:hypothetical protein